MQRSRGTANGSEILYCEYYREHSTGRGLRAKHDVLRMYMGQTTYSGPSGMGMPEGSFCNQKFMARILLK